MTVRAVGPMPNGMLHSTTTRIIVGTAYSILGANYPYTDSWCRAASATDVVSMASGSFRPFADLRLGVMKPRLLQRWTFCDPRYKWVSLYNARCARATGRACASFDRTRFLRERYILARGRVATQHRTHRRSCSVSMLALNPSRNALSPKSPQ